MTRFLSWSLPLGIGIMLSMCSLTDGRAGDVLSEEEYLAGVEAAYPSSSVMNESLAIAQAEARRARILENPEVFAERETPGGGREQLTYSVTWQPPLDGRRNARIDAAQSGVEVARTRQLESRAELRAELREVYAAWAVATEREAIVAGQLDRLRMLVRGTGERARVGDESGLVARRFSLAAIEVEAMAATSRARLAETRLVALAWLGDMQRDAEPLRPALPAESLLNAPGEHPAVAARRFEVQRAEAELRLTRRFIQFPEITVGRVDIEEPGFKSAGLLVGGSWPLPLFDRQQPEQAGAASRLTAARVRLEIEKTRRQARWDGGLAGYSELRRAALAASDSLASVDSVIQAATARFNAGESTATDLLETLGSVLGARLAALDLFEEALAAHRRLELAALRWSSEQEVKP